MRDVQRQFNPQPKKVEGVFDPQKTNTQSTIKTK